MKSKLFLYLIPVFLFLITAWTNPKLKIQRERSTIDSKLPLIDLRTIPTEVFDLKLSDLIAAFEVISIETKKECLIGNTKIVFTKNNILIGTQTQEGARLYRFDKTGRFLNEIGKTGKGPGEHTGRSAQIINCYEENETVLVNWFGSGEKAQLFKMDGTFLYSITRPIDFVSDINKWSDSVWFSTGKFSGPAVMKRDSFALVFHTNKGKITDIFPRRTFPPKNANGYIPSPHTASLYKFNSTWKLYMGGNDTVFKIIDKKLIPSAILLMDKSSLPRNSTIPPDGLVGKYYLDILAETENNWILRKTIVKKAEVIELRPGNWSESFEAESILLIIDKKSKKGRFYNLKDDIFSLLPDEPSIMGAQWQDNNRIFVSIQAINLLKLFKDKQDLINKNPKAQKVIEQLKDLKVDSNPVIFTFTLKDRIAIE